MESIEKEIKKLNATCDFILKTKFESLLSGLSKEELVQLLTVIKMEIITLHAELITAMANNDKDEEKRVRNKILSRDLILNTLLNK